MIITIFFPSVLSWSCLIRGKESILRRCMFILYSERRWYSNLTHDFFQTSGSLAVPEIALSYNPQELNNFSQIAASDWIANEIFTYMLTGKPKQQLMFKRATVKRTFVAEKENNSIRWSMIYEADRTIQFLNKSLSVIILYQGLLHYRPAKRLFHLLLAVFGFSKSKLLISNEQ